LGALLREGAPRQDKRAAQFKTNVPYVSQDRIIFLDEHQSILTCSFYKAPEEKKLISAARTTAVFCKPRLGAQVGFDVAQLACFV
jgi:hypothetical protein